MQETKANLNINDIQRPLMSGSARCRLQTEYGTATAYTMRPAGLAVPAVQDAVHNHYLYKLLLRAGYAVRCSRPFLETVSYRQPQHTSLYRKIAGINLLHAHHLQIVVLKTEYSYAPAFVFRMVCQIELIPKRRCTRGETNRYHIINIV